MPTEIYLCVRHNLTTCASFVMIDSDGIRTVLYPCGEDENKRRDLITGPRLGITVKDRLDFAEP